MGNGSVSGTAIFDTNSNATYKNGTISGVTSAGEATFTLQILSSGKFNLVVKTSNSLSISKANTSTFTIVNSVSAITIIPASQSPVIYFNFNVSVTVLGADYNNYLGNCSLTLFYDSANLGHAQTYTGNYTFLVHLTNLVSSNFTTSCGGVSGISKEIVPSNETLLIYQPSPMPTKSSQTFNITVYITDGLNNLETALNNPVGHIISLSLISVDNTTSGLVLSGIQPIKSTNGTCIFSGLRILSSGSFYIRASSGDGNATPAQTSSPVHIINTVKSIKASISSSPILTYFSFNITVNLYGDDSNLFIQTAETSLSTSDNSLQGELSSNISTGSGIFSVYFSDYQVKSIKISTNDPFGFSYT